MATEEIDNLEIWAQKAKKQVEDIISQLCEVDSLLEEVPEDNISLMELLQSINDIQKRHEGILTNISSLKMPMSDMRNNLQVQLQILEKTFNLLKMEEPTTP